jgi:hypothetical protein
METLKSMHVPEPEKWLEKPRLKLTLRRERILQDSYRDLMRANSNRLRLRLNIQYSGEPGLDYGGLSREWYTLISEEIIRRDYALFIPCEGNSLMHINPHSYVNPDHLDFFRFVGRLLAKALFDQFLFGVYFTPVFYKGLQGVTPRLDDLKQIEPQVYGSLQDLRAMSREDLESIGLTFTVTENAFDNPQDIDLIENGHNIEVTGDNLEQYISLQVQYYLQGRIREQMEAVRLGFNELIPPQIVECFTPREMENLLSGSQEVDVKDWKKNTIYIGFSESSDAVVWFWNIIDSMTNEDRLKVLQFVTGTEKVPPGGMLFSHMF